MDLIIEILKYVGLGASILLIIALSILIAVWLFATALYVIPAKQQKIDLKKVVNTEYEQRIILDDYQFTIASEQQRERLEKNVETIKDIENRIRKKAAALKSLEAKIEALENEINTSKKAKKEFKK